VPCLAAWHHDLFIHTASKRADLNDLALAFDLTQAVVGSLSAQRFFNAQQLIVLGYAVRTS
jgi:hypothetical protein